MFNWSFIDKCVCICLLENKYNVSPLRAHCEQIGLTLSMEFVTRHKDGGIVGCFHSHRKVMQDALNESRNNMLVFEDDARPFSNTISSDVVTHIKQCVQSADWDIIYIGYMPHPLARLTNSQFTGLSHCTKSWMAHAYIINRSYMENIVAYNGPPYHIDMLLVDNTKKHKSYYVSPMIYYQDDRENAVSMTWILSKPFSLKSIATIAEQLSIHYVLVYTICLITISLISLSACNARYCSTHCIRRKYTRQCLILFVILSLLVIWFIAMLCVMVAIIHKARKVY